MKELDKLLPDFDDLLKKLDEIKALEFDRVLLDLEIRNMEADIYKEAVTDASYFVGGKPPAISYIKQTYAQTGFNGELKDRRQKLADITVELDYEKNKLSTYNKMIEVWRTISANERKTTI